jgi:hypothetical protein
LRRDGASVPELYVALISRNMTFSAILFPIDADIGHFQYFSRYIKLSSDDPYGSFLRLFGPKPMPRHDSVF